MDARVTAAHVAGLVVGEGCFYAESCADPKYRSGWRIRPAFCIEMRHDDREALEHVRSHLGCGEIYELNFGRYKGYEDKGWQPHVKYRVSRISDLHHKVVPFFREHELFGRKRIAFQLFADLVAVVKSGQHRTGEGLQAARALAEALRAHNRRG